MNTPPLPPPGLRDAIGIAARDRALYLIAATFVALSLAWNFVTPIFEAPDETDHLQYILFVAKQGRPPDLWTDVPTSGTASFESPLYYLITGWIVRLSGIDTPFVHPVRNPDFSFERPGSDSNYFLRTPIHYDYVHFIRFFSSLFGAVVVLCTYLAATLLGLDRKIVLFSTAATAFLPQFTFISGVINNDTLAAALASVGIVYLLYLTHLRLPNPHEWFMFGAICAAAVLAKPHTIFLLPLAAWLVVSNRKNRSQVVVTGAVIALGFLVFAGPYLVYNSLHYGDPFAVRLQESIVSSDQIWHKNPFSPEGIAYFALLLPNRLFASFLGVFGWMIIYLPLIFYLIFAVVGIISVGGIMTALLGGKWSFTTESLILAPLLILVIILYANLTFNSNQGRYFFPALSAISILFVLGLAELPRYIRSSLFIFSPVFLLVVNLYSLWLVWSTLGQP